ncbi:MAG TPA: response regulator transcription factor [Acidimicrobiales bacterium]|nr:response regulator transcription factor [Acidimicrobiales bacterium]
MGTRLVFAEDDRAIREAVTRALVLEGHEVRAVADGQAALDAIAQEAPDAVVLDWMMPVVDGLTACRRLRASGSHVPILILTARAEVTDRVSGLDAGADDYLPKPFALDEFLARVRALLRRGADPSAEKPWRVDDLVVDAAARRAWRGDRELDLTKTEFELLAALARNAGIVCTHASLYDAVWAYDFGPESKTLAVYVGYLRR